MGKPKANKILVYRATALTEIKKKQLATACADFANTKTLKSLNELKVYRQLYTYETVFFCISSVFNFPVITFILYSSHGI